MDALSIITILLGITGTLSWAIIRVIWHRLDKQQLEVTAFRVHVAEKYATNEHMDRRFDDVMSLLRRIEDRLNVE